MREIHNLIGLGGWPLRTKENVSGIVCIMWGGGDPGSMHLASLAWFALHRRDSRCRQIRNLLYHPVRASHAGGDRRSISAGIVIATSLGFAAREFLDLASANRKHASCPFPKRQVSRASFVELPTFSSEVDIYIYIYLFIIAIYIY